MYKLLPVFFWGPKILDKTRRGKQINKKELPYRVNEYLCPDTQRK
jgi:hypothetical protein